MRNLSWKNDLLIVMFMSLVLPPACSVCALLRSMSTTLPIFELAIAAFRRLLTIDDNAYPLRCAATLLSPTYMPVASSVAAKPSRVSSSTDASSRVIVSSSGASRKKPIVFSPIESSAPFTRTPVRKSTRRVSSPSVCTSAFTCCEAATSSMACPNGPLNVTVLPESTWKGMMGYIFGE